MNPRPKPYFDSNDQPCLEESVIVVADVLGFSALVGEAFETKKELEQLGRIHSALEKAARNVSGPSEGAKWFTKFFSDNVVIGYPFIGFGNGRFEFPQACHSIGRFQIELALMGFFIRGGIAVGRIHMSDNLIYGQILEELKQAEKRASSPRVVLLDSAVDHMISLCPDRGGLLRDILWNDTCDDSVFVNYLYPLGARNDDNRGDGMLKHKEYIESNLKIHRGDNRVVQKYNWLLKYHNRFCSNSVHWNDKKYLIAV